MKTTILIVRHAKSIANEKGLFGGITDYDLSEKGFTKAENLATRLIDFTIDAIYSSPLKRAIQTITPTAKAKGLKTNIVDDLREMNVGTWENKLRDDLRKEYPEENKYIDKTSFYCGMIGQEETIDVANRMFNCIKDLAQENINKTIIVTSHLVAIRAFLCKILNIPFELTKEKIGHLGNTSITKIIYDDNNQTFEVIKMDDMS